MPDSAPPAAPPASPPPVPPSPPPAEAPPPDAPRQDSTDPRAARAPVVHDPKDEPDPQTPEPEAPRTPPEPATPAAETPPPQAGIAQDGKKYLTDPRKARPGAEKPAEDKTPEEEPSLPEDTPTEKVPRYARELAKAHDAKKREAVKLQSEVATLTAELEKLRKAPASAANSADIATAEAARAEAIAAREELEQTRKTLARVAVTETPEYRAEHGRLSSSAKEINSVIATLKDYGITGDARALVQELREGNGAQPLYNSIIQALRDSSNPAGEERVKSHLQAILASQDRIYALTQEGAAAAEKWKSDRGGAVAGIVENEVKRLGTVNPLFDRKSQQWMSLPQDYKDSITSIQDDARKAAEYAVSITSDPDKLALAAYSTQLAVGFANSAHQGAIAEIERLTAEHDRERQSSAEEITALKARLSGYERAAQSSPGGLARSAPVQSGSNGAPVRYVTDPRRAAQH